MPAAQVLDRGSRPSPIRRKHRDQGKEFRHLGGAVRRPRHRRHELRRGRDHRILGDAVRSGPQPGGRGQRGAAASRREPRVSPARRDPPARLRAELYFWSSIVALSVFAVGAGVATYEGVDHIRNPSAIRRPEIILVVLAIASLFEGTSWIIAVKEFRARQAGLGWRPAFRQSKDPRLFMTLFEDSASLAGIAVATIHLAPEQVVAYFSVAFDSELRTRDIEVAVKVLEERIRAAHPQVLAIFVKPQAAQEARRGLPSVARGSSPTRDGYAGDDLSRRFRDEGTAR